MYTKNWKRLVKEYSTNGNWNDNGKNSDDKNMRNNLSNAPGILLEWCVFLGIYLFKMIVPAFLHHIQNTKKKYKNLSKTALLNEQNKKQNTNNIKIPIEWNKWLVGYTLCELVYLL